MHPLRWDGQPQLTIPTNPVSALPAEESTARTRIADAATTGFFSVMKLKIVAIFRNHRPSTDWQQVLLHCVSHYEFGVDLMAIENHILVMLLLAATTNTMLRENRVKRPTRCGCIVGRSSLLIVLRGSAVG